MADDTGGMANRAATLIRSILKLPDIRGAAEAFILFVAVMAAGAAAVWAGALVLDPAPRAVVSGLFVTMFFVPAFAEELAFRSWLRRDEPLVAGLSMIGFVLWHPLQVAVGSPFAHAAFVTPGFLALTGVLGFACTMSRLRSGTIWTGVVIHWGAAVVWRALFSGAPAN
jgi:uncharacterized protein